MLNDMDAWMVTYRDHQLGLTFFRFYRSGFRARMAAFCWTFLAWDRTYSINPPERLNQ